MTKITIGLLIFGFMTCAFSLELKNRAYEDFVIKISEAVPKEHCKTVLENLEITLTSASQYLFSALDSRAFLRSATVLLPPTWPDSCSPSTILSANGDLSDLTILPQGPARGHIYTQQSLGCGQSGDQIYLTHDSLLHKDHTLARTLVKEFAKYRYGVFDEIGYYNDPVYPLCYFDDEEKKAKITGCSELPINDMGVCNDINAPYNRTLMVDDKARSSIMFAPEALSISMFCDGGNHNRYAPTKHNSMCQSRSVLDIILNHSDFSSNSINNVNTNQITDTTPKIIYKKENLTRYVFVIENTKDMMLRESWSYLRLAMRHWALNILPDNSEVGIVLTDEISTKALNILSIKDNSNRFGARDKFYSTIPYTPGDSIQLNCLHCSIKIANDMLMERTKINGHANNVIVIIGAGLEPNQQLDKIINEVNINKIKIVTINYPTIVRSQSLNILAEKTSGIAYTVFEQKLNVDTTLLSTYFQLQNVLYNIVERYYSGSKSDLPIEIHRREITNDGRNSITGSFFLDSNMGEPAQFTFFTHNTVTPLIKGLKLISPSHQIFTHRMDRFIDFKMILLNSNMSEAGSWTYIVEPYPGNPQPHFIQVMATPSSSIAPIVRVKFWTKRIINGPLLLLAEVKRGEMPIIGAKVEVLIDKPEVNGSFAYKAKYELFDTGAGDPDITKGDGIYTRYFNDEFGPGLYTFELMASDNGNTAYTLSQSVDDKPCCGSLITSNGGATPISPFQRILPKLSKFISQEDIDSSKHYSVGRIGDLKAEIIPEDMKARLSWTSPDMGGHDVSHYEVKYSMNLNDIMDKFETSAISWDNGQPLPLAPGSETTFSMDFSQNRELLDKVIYVAIKSNPKGVDFSGTISNWIRVLVPSPPPPPTVPPTSSSSSNEQNYWPNNINTVGVDPVTPSIAKAMGVGLELILPISIGFILLVILLVLYCYFCVSKRRDNRDTHKKTSSKKNDKLSSATITIIPGSPQNIPQLQQNYITDIPDPHTIGVPIKYEYEDDTKKRYSLVNQQEQQLIEELKQQQQQQQLQQQREMMGTPNNGYSGLSIISNATLQRNNHLSPYNSWSASQLLHEHERRHSPMDNMIDTIDQINNQQELLINQDHISLNGQQIDMITEHCLQQCHIIPPPVPPLPSFNQNGYPINYNIYGVHQQQQQQQQQQQPPPPLQPPSSNSNQSPIYQSMQRTNTNNEPLMPFNPSLQGSLSSVNSGDKKRRNVTMV